MKRAEKRDHLVAVAAALFNKHGYHAVGIDQVIAEAGIAKTTLYRHFPSKDDLIVAALRRIDEQFLADMRRTVDAAGGGPADRLLATFDFLAAWFRRKTFHGCPFLGAAGEYADRANPVFQETVVHKRLMVAYFEELARAAGLEDPRGVAEQIHLLHEGATAVAQISGDPAAADRARAVAARLIANPPQH